MLPWQPTGVMRVWQLLGDDNHRWQLECCESDSSNQWCLLQKISSVLSVIVLAPGGMLYEWRIPQQPAHLVVDRHWPYLGPKWGSDICGVCDILEWFARRLLTGWLEESWEYLRDKLCNILLNILCETRFMLSTELYMFSVSSTAVHVCACRCLLPLSNLNPGVCLMFYSAIYRIVLWWQII